MDTGTASPVTENAWLPPLEFKMCTFAIGSGAFVSVLAKPISRSSDVTEDTASMKVAADGKCDGASNVSGDWVRGGDSPVPVAVIITDTRGAGRERSKVKLPLKFTVPTRP